MAIGKRRIMGCLEASILSGGHVLVFQKHKLLPERLNIFFMFFISSNCLHLSGHHLEVDDRKEQGHL